MLCRDPRKRLAVTSIWQHPWIGGPPRADEVAPAPVSLLDASALGGQAALVDACLATMEAQGHASPEEMRALLREEEAGGGSGCCPQLATFHMLLHQQRMRQQQAVRDADMAAMKQNFVRVSLRKRAAAAGSIPIAGATTPAMTPEPEPWPSMSPVTSAVPVPAPGAKTVSPFHRSSTIHSPTNHQPQADAAEGEVLGVLKCRRRRSRSVQSPTRPSVSPRATGRTGAVAEVAITTLRSPETSSAQRRRSSVAEVPRTRPASLALQQPQQNPGSQEQNGCANQAKNAATGISSISGGSGGSIFGSRDSVCTRDSLLDSIVFSRNSLTDPSSFNRDGLVDSAFYGGSSVSTAGSSSGSGSGPGFASDSEASSGSGSDAAADRRFALWKEDADAAPMPRSTDQRAPTRSPSPPARGRRGSCTMLGGEAVAGDTSDWQHQQELVRLRDQLRSRGRSRSRGRTPSTDTPSRGQSPSPALHRRVTRLGPSPAPLQTPPPSPGVGAGLAAGLRWPNPASLAAHIVSSSDGNNDLPAFATPPRRRNRKIGDPLAASLDARHGRRRGLLSQMCALAEGAEGQDSSDGLPEVVDASAAFGAATTSSRPVADLMAQIKACLRLVGIDFTTPSPQRVLCMDRRGERRGGGGVGLLRWEMEVVRLKGLELHGIRLRRLHGELWTYKKTVAHVMQQLKL